MARTPWYESDNPDRIARAAGWRIILVVIAAAAIGFGAWGIRVLTSGVRGQGDAVISKNSAANWTAAQARFRALHEEILATDRKLDLLAAQANANPGDRVAQTTYTGTVSYCLGVVGTYNAEAKSYLSQDFRDSDLPERINDSDPRTDCKETRK